MPGWQNSDRRNRLPPNWSSLRKQVFRRDGYRCTARDVNGERCPEPAAECDHVLAGDDHRLTNLTSLCTWHHGRKSGAEGAKAKAAARARNHRKFQRTEAHPGLIP